MRRPEPEPMCRSWRSADCRSEPGSCGTARRVLPEHGSCRASPGLTQGHAATAEGAGVLGYIFAGIALGSIYAIAASGIVVTYVSSGVLNFAFGSIAYFLARFYYYLNTQ